MKWFIDLIGIAANIAFMVACLPTAVETIKTGRSIGTPIGLALNIMIACLLYYTYTFFSYAHDPLVWFSGVLEVPCYSAVIWYHYFPRKH